MEFAFKRKESVPESIRRLGAACVESALESCSEPELEAIHSTRKQIKKMRALLRLVRCEIGKQQFKQGLDDLREAASYLSSARDAHVKAQAFDELRPRARKGTAATDSFEQLRRGLKNDCRIAALRFREENCARPVRKLLRKEAKTFAKLDFRNDGWAAIEPGLKKSYRAAREARDLALRQPVAENFHAWRKQVKDLWYNVQLLHPIWPEQMCAVATDLENLSECLGDDHDLHELRLTVIKKSVDGNLEAEAARLLPLIDARQTELRFKAIKLGNRFFSEKPSEFSDRLHRFWKLWKSRGKKGSSRALVPTV